MPTESENCWVWSEAEKAQLIYADSWVRANPQPRPGSLADGIVNVLLQLGVVVSAKAKRTMMSNINNVKTSAKKEEGKFKQLVPTLFRDAVALGTQDGQANTPARVESGGRPLGAAVIIEW